MPKYVVEGGVPLNGTIRPAGNKNAALPIICAALLSDEPVTLENVPDIRDVRTLLDLLVQLGCVVEWLGDDVVRIEAVAGFLILTLAEWAFTKARGGGHD